MPSDSKRPPKANVPLALASILVRMPWWAVKNIPPSRRPRRSWSVGRCVKVKSLRTAFASIVMKYVLNTINEG